MPKQSSSDRLKRLDRGCCPIHGIFMSQVDDWYVENDGRHYTIVGCSRKNCNVCAKAYNFDGPWEILPDFAYLLDEALIALELTNKLPREKTVRSPRAKKSAIWNKTKGRCYYCGLLLDWKTTFTVDHIIPRIGKGGHQLENVVPCCRSCNSAKGDRDIEEFRFNRSIQLFQEQTGVLFTMAQIAYLESVGVHLQIPIYWFWFEQQYIGQAKPLYNNSGAAD
jgi:hypothetical protein